MVLVAVVVSSYNSLSFSFHAFHSRINFPLFANLVGIKERFPLSKMGLKSQASTYRLSLASTGVALLEQSVQGREKEMELGGNMEGGKVWWEYEYWEKEERARDNDSPCNSLH